MDYISGSRAYVHADLLMAGFKRIGEDMYQKGERRIRWVSDREKILGIEGDGRKFILREPFDREIELEAKVRSFVVTTEI